jgi:hypothetical protein
MGKWMYKYIFFYLGTGCWRWVVGFISVPHYAPGKDPPMSLEKEEVGQTPEPARKLWRSYDS